jgi:hypothetical protein
MQFLMGAGQGPGRDLGNGRWPTERRQPESGRVSAETWEWSAEHVSCRLPRLGPLMMHGHKIGRVTTKCALKGDFGVLFQHTPKNPLTVAI